MQMYLRIFTSRRMAVLLLLGISSGLPLALVFGTLQAWMKDAGIDLALIASVTVLGLPYTFKFLWAPLMDRYTPPFLGRRRGWLVLTQLGLMAAIVVMAGIDPASQTALLFALAVLISFLSASQDIVADAYRSDVLQTEELGVGAAVFVLGYRLGMLLSGAMALILSDLLPWQTVYQIMAALMAIGLLAALWGPEPEALNKPQNLRTAVIEPFKAFFKRDYAWLFVALILCYKLPDALAGAVTTPFLMDIGFSKTDIGAMNKGLGLFATIIGALWGGALVARYGIYRCLWGFGILQAVSNLAFMMLALQGPSYVGLMLAVGIENISGGMGTAAFVAFLMSLTQRQYSATQYALLSSLMAVMPKLIGPLSGVMTVALGWPIFYALSVLAAAPGLALLWWLLRQPQLLATIERRLD